MELRVVPSNGPIPAENEDVPLSPPRKPYFHQTYPEFNSDIDCRSCDLPHKTGILRDGSGNIGSGEPSASLPDSKHGQQHGGEPSALTNSLEHPSQNQVKLAHKKLRKSRTHYGRHSLENRPEWDSAKYRQYREKIRNKPDSIWPEHVEEAFQEAIRIYPARGRKKEMLNGKLSGGNEFITHWIKKRTGEKRDRKQVSSHIQVLKKFYPPDSAWIALVTANGMLKTKGSKQPAQIKYDSAASFGPIVRSHSHHTQVTQPRCVPPLTPLTPQTFGADLSCRPTIRRVDFSMTLGRGKTLVRNAPNFIHSYTSIQSESGSAPLPLEDLQDWRVYYPRLADYHSQGQLDCPVFLFDTSLSLMEDHPGMGAHLSINSSLDITQGVTYTNWQSLTRFYEQGGKPIDLAEFYEKYHENPGLGKPLMTLDTCPSTVSTDTTLEGLPLKSKWWVETFSKMMDRSIQAKATGDSKALKLEDERTERYIRGISVMHEIYANPYGDNSNPERVAILLWKFSKARRDQAATTTWRKLIPPAPPCQVPSPISPDLLPFFAPDTRVHDPKMGSSVAASCGSCYGPQQQQDQPSIFADNAEDLLDGSLTYGSSRGTTPHSDYTSFPSSTGTSFPSNNSNQGFAPQFGPDSTFQSQDSVYPSLESFSSQGSQFASQELMVNSQDLCYDSQGVFYSPQNALYNQGSTHNYDWPDPQSFIAEDPAAFQDFTTDGKTQATLPEDHDGNNLMTYEPHLFAPRANATPQHQLIQHPEQFDHHDYLEPELNAVQSQQQQGLDWELIESQPIQVVDMRLEGNGMGGSQLSEGVVLEYEDCGEDVLVREEVDVDERVLEQGCILGEVGEEQVGLERGLEEYHY